MCIIAMIPAGKQINKNTLENMTNNNPDGSGIAWIQDNKIKTYKTMDNEKFINKALEVQSKFCKDSDILIHCRIATSGKTDLDNCHPFKISNDTVFAHNGILNCVEATNKVSDTRIFNKALLKQLKPEFLDNVTTRKLIGEIIKSDKLAFLTVNPKLKRNSYIINRDLGEKENRVWFSNDSYKEKTYVTDVCYNWNLRPDYDSIEETPHDDETLPANVFQPFDQNLEVWLRGNDYEDIIISPYRTDKVDNKLASKNKIKLNKVQNLDEAEYADLYFDTFGIECPVIVEDTMHESWIF
tara:strand:+ start:819 stop:1709 length:891 start_codon:yes stop_codon:yes gene_type:complete